MWQEIVPTWFLAMSVSFVTLLFVMTFCLPTLCRKNSPKEELFGVEGRMTLCNPDASATSVDTPDNNECANNIFPSAETNGSTFSLHEDRGSHGLHRQLPDIPIEEDDGEQSNSIETGSELYETVETNVLPTKKPSHKKRPAPKAPSEVLSQNGIPREATPSSDSEAMAESSLRGTPSERHHYASVKKENPYAKVRGAQNSLDADETDTDNYDVAPQLPSSSNEDSVPVPVDIPAASAIAGRLPANPELPYMTPPLLLARAEEQAAAESDAQPMVQVQTNFSGDSQDSKGYTSISVREPLANLKARTGTTDPHYATVPDDNEEVYSAIEDPSGALYAECGSPPAPPSVDSLRHVAQQAHSRQASSSSAATSPKQDCKPNRRTTGSTGNDLPLPASPLRLDDMYAKVTKKKSPTSAPPQGTSSAPQASEDATTTQPEPGPSWASGPATTESEPLVPRRRAKSEINFSEYEVVRDVPKRTVALATDDSDEAGYESLGEHNLDDPGYEKVRSNPEQPDPGYERVGTREVDDDPNYETVPDCRRAEVLDVGARTGPNDDASASVGAGTSTSTVAGGGVAELPLYAHVNKAAKKRHSDGLVPPLSGEAPRRHSKVVGLEFL